jgi:hypothetical protein
VSGERANAHQLSELLRAAEVCLDNDNEAIKAIRAELVVEVLQLVEASGFDQDAVLAATRRLQSMPGRSS